jgi:hypothetical protein
MAGLGTQTTALHKIADGKNGLNELLTLLLRSFARSESESGWHCIEFISVGNIQRSAAFLRPVKAHLRDRCAAREPRLARGFSMADQATALDQGTTSLAERHCNAQPDHPTTPLNGCSALY